LADRPLSHSVGATAVTPLARVTRWLSAHKSPGSWQPTMCACSATFWLH